MSAEVLDIHESLSNETVLYRTIDFFSAASIVTSEQLWFSRADTFLDKNEGVELLLLQLSLASPNNSCAYGWSDNETAQERHNQLKKCHFISCWSREGESVAMWSLYSSDHCSVRISSTVGKLRAPMEAFLSKYNIERFSSADTKTKALVAASGQIAPVKYVSLNAMSMRVNRRAKAFQRIADRYHRKGEPMPSSKYGENDEKFFEREERRRFSDLQTTCRLKDLSFQHEAEVRLLVRLGAIEVSEKLLELLNSRKTYTHLSWKQSLGFLVGFDSLSIPVPESESMPCGPSLIDSVAIDPRCPKHKADFIRDWFLNRGIKVVESTCFGYLPDSFEVFPKG